MSARVQPPGLLDPLDDDDDDEKSSLVFKGSRNYDNPLAPLGDRLGDALKSVSIAANQVKGAIVKDEAKATNSKVTLRGDEEPQLRKTDAGPRTPDSQASASDAVLPTGGSSDPEGESSLDSVMAQLLAMGFEAEMVSQLLSSCWPITLLDATTVLLETPGASTDATRGAAAGRAPEPTPPASVAAPPASVAAPPASVAAPPASVAAPAVAAAAPPAVAAAAAPSPRLAPDPPVSATEFIGPAPSQPAPQPPTPSMVPAVATPAAAPAMPSVATTLPPPPGGQAVPPIGLAGSASTEAMLVFEERAAPAPAPSSDGDLLLKLVAPPEPAVIPAPVGAAEVPAQIQPAGAAPLSAALFGPPAAVRRPPLPSPPLPPGWRTGFDSSVGLPYYFCEATQTSHWEPPAPPSQSAWVACSDPSTGGPYWYNTVTRQSQWVPP